MQWFPEYGDGGVSAGVWVSAALVLMLLANLLPAKKYGQMEYVVGSIKLTFLVVLILFNVVIAARSGQLAFWTWNKPYGFAKTTFTVREGVDLPEGPRSTFAAFWTGLSTCFFSMMGWDVILVTAPENKDLRKEETVKISSRKLALRVVVLYCLAVFTVGLNVPSDDPPLRSVTINDVKGGQNSIFIIAAIRAHVPFMPHFLNGFFIFSAFFTGCSALYCSARLLHAIASREDAWPEWRVAQSIRTRLERTRWGVPTNAVIVSWLFGFLAYMSTGENPTKVSSIPPAQLLVCR
jgi:amino acid transporter